MSNPPARSTAWRKGFNTPVNYDDNGLNCGGKAVQHEMNGGKCGVCGDRFDLKRKPNEPGPGNRYATGTIVATYQAGQTIDVETRLTAYHQGYYELRLCKNDIPQTGNDPSIAVTQECLNENLLTNEAGSTRFLAGPDVYTQKAVLPSGVTCNACVLQWRYKAGNSWGCGRSEDGRMSCGLGHGDQEEFIGCADIAITN
jgi:hypothetical protein